MRKITVIALLLAGLVLGTACEKYEKAEENSSFVVSGFVSDGYVVDGALLVVSLEDGSIDGKCALSMSLKEKGGKMNVPFVLKTNSGIGVDESYVWSFDESRKAEFRLTGLPAGSYRAELSIRRWYHSSSCVMDFEIKN